MAQPVQNLQQEQDSIQKLIASTENIEDKVKAYTNAYHYFVRRNPTIAESFAKNGLTYAQKYHLTKAQIGFYNNLGMLSVIQRQYDQALQSFKSALQLTNNESLLEQNLNIKNHIASVLFKQGHQNSAKQLLDSILQIAKKNHLLRPESTANDKLGKFERSNGNYEKSLACFNRNLIIAKQLNHLDQISYAYLQLAIDYDKTGEAKRAIELNKKGLNISLKGPNKHRIENFYNNLAVNYRNLQQYDSALYYHFKVLNSQKQRKNPIMIGTSYMNIGTTLAHKKDFNKAIKYQDSALKVISITPNKPLLTNIYKGLAKSHQGIQKYQKANHYNLKALGIIQAYPLKNTSSKLDIYKNLYDSYKKLNKIDSALYFHEKIALLKDSLYNTNKLSNTEAVKRQIETSDQQHQIEQLDYRNTRNKIIYFSITGAFISLGILLYLWAVGLKRKNKIINQEKKLEEQRVLNLIQNQEIEAFNAHIQGQETERQKIAEELHDNLGSTLATIKLHIENLANQKDINATIKKTLQNIESLINDSYQKIRHISHLKSDSFVEQQGLLNAFKKLSKQINTNNTTKVNFDLFGFDTIERNDLKVLIYNTVQELLTNAIKHANSSEINVQITKHINDINILVTDNGTGFKYTPQTLEKGMGLYQIRKRLASIGGTMEIDSTPGIGTTININIPL
ncbi:MAG TPA: tetratricopeptide repeat protein [Flavobacteriales bacterium]|nr:tetratricopeptide repeat protein [Flavobacteriales bacterium]